MLREECWEGCLICCEASPIGKDYALAVWGGEKPHIGSVVMAVARPSLSGEGISTTSSVLNVVGHKDEEVARFFAEETAKKTNGIAVCSCGIHVDQLSGEKLIKIQAACRRLLRQVLEQLENRVAKGD